MAHVEFELENDILWIVINRPEAMGAMTAEMRNAIIDRLITAQVEAAVRVVVLTGTGRGFCTGADLSRPLDSPRSNEPLPVFAARDAMRFGSQRLLRALWELEKPVIAAVNGTAAGLGAHIAFACDLILAAEGVRFIEVFVRRGIAIDAAGGFLLPRVLPLCRAKELVFFGDDFSAGDAERVGLINRVVPPDQLVSVAREWAERLAKGPTFAIGISKRLLNRGTETGMDTCFGEEAFAQTLVSSSDDAKEGMQAFREKRKPTFRGR
jgi:2-(1,2-epoxy-1,2-dihydrophenyl)acetyl-CoA isomerase